MGGENGNEGDKNDASLFLFSFLELSHFNRAAILHPLLRKQTCLPMSQLGCLTLHTSFLRPSEKKRNTCEISPRKKCRKRGNEPGPFFPHQFFRLCRGVPDSLTTELSCGQLNRAERSWKPSTELGTAKVSSLFCPREKKRNLTTDEKMKS